MVYSVMGTRNGDQCWKRWNDHLDPSINHGPWDSHEDSLLFAAVESMGRSWSEIVGTYLPGRTALGAKNRFTLLNRRPEVDNTAPGTSQSVASSSLSASSIQSPEYEEFDFLSLGIESATADFVLNHMDTANLDPEILQSCSMNSPLAQVTDQNLEDLSSEHPLSKIDPTISNYPELSDSALIQDDQGGCSAPPIEHSGTESTSSQGDSPSSVMKELTIKLKCRSGRTETIMGGLTALMNNLMVKGDVKDVSISIS
ncbi:hypothetical protein F4678DRAFT_447979 [Xylaria arbuscula]|nr:hypothetical protein F4678DRAFT_447979 [Xylaria arbuscula]